jgi:hypothetical protein
MATDREVALEQALIAVIGAVQHRNLDARDVVDHASALLLGNNPIRYAGHPHVSDAITEIGNAYNEVQVLTK